MHCLYCDRPLALLKRLTGDGEFCSKEHRRIYQQEHNQLALARLLESQPKTDAKARPDRAQKLKPETQIVERVAEPVKQPEPEPESPQPDLAGFMSDALEAGPAPGATRFTSHPRFRKGSPVWSGVSNFRGRPGPRPKAAGFVAESSRPGYAAGAAGSQNKSDFKGPARKFLLEQKSQPAGAGRRQLSRAGFVFGQPAARLSAAGARPPGDARFRPLAPITASPAGILRMGRHSKLRMAKFLSSSGIARTAPGRVRVPAIQSRWKPLSPALPAQTSAKITLVLGSFLQRPVRPASQDLFLETFEIPFHPVSFPPYSPRMECLEERLHRTDRIGFSPP